MNPKDDKTIKVAFEIVNSDSSTFQWDAEIITGSWISLVNSSGEADHCKYHTPINYWRNCKTEWASIGTNCQTLSDAYLRFAVKRFSYISSNLNE